MINIYRNLFLKSNIIVSIIIFFFSFFINYYYSKLGVFPIDTFFHYDSGNRILKDEYPIRDFWIVSGFIIDLIQSGFFKIFGVNWHAYIIHSSIFNFLISLLVYFFFISLKIEKLKSLIFTCCFSTLAYTTSGTPFVDHHAIFFLLASTIFLIKAIQSEKKYFWFLFNLFFFLSFFTKQVPATYVFLAQSLLICFYILNEKKYFILKQLIFGTVLLLLIFFLYLLYIKIDLNNFYIQYFDYPRSIGASRFENFSINLNGFFNHYKFLMLPFFGIILLRFYKSKKKFTYTSNKEIYFFVIVLTFVFGSIFHQIMTKNQIYIYFIIPILFGVLDREFSLSNFKKKKYISIFLIFCLFLITIKYHYRFNENRKFHELENTNFDYAIPAGNLNKKLAGLEWINPFFKGRPAEEISIIKKGINVLNNEKTEIMLMSHYLFLDSLTKKNLNFPNRSFTDDGASMPLRGNKYFNYYKRYFMDKINDKDIKKIFYFKHEKIPQITLTDYLSSDCYNKSEEDVFFIFYIKCVK